MTARIAAILRCLYASTKLGFCLLSLVPGFALADGTPAIANSPISIQSVTLTERSKPGQSAVLPLPVRSYRDQRELSAFRADAEFHLPTVPEASRWVLYTQDLRDGGALSINGVEVGTVPTATQHHTVRHLQPFMFDIPAGVLQAGRNTLVREWSVKENHVFVPRMMLGAKEDIEPLYAQRYFWQYTMAQVSFVFAAIISLILLGLYSQNRSAHQYLWGGASALGWGILNLAYFLTPIPTVLFAYWQLVIHCGLWAFSAGGNFYLLHECGVNHRWYRQISVAWGLAFVVGYIVNFWTTGQTFWPNYTLIWHAGIAAFGLYPVTRLVIATWQQRKLRHLVYLLITLSGITAGALDAATVSGIDISPSNGYLLQTVAPVWFISICFALISDFSRSLRAQREQQQQLVNQLDAQRHELERLHVLARATQEKQAAAQERARIMQDMHDGLGSQLVSSLAMAQSGALSATQTYDLLRSCIDDLRLAIDASGESADSLLLALGNLRFRMEPRLKSAGIVLRWNTQDLSDKLPLSAERQLPVLRVIQETIANTLKHAQATTLSVTVVDTPTELTVSITDDGHGFDVAKVQHSAHGKGLNSLAKRARVLGAQLDIASSAQGTHTRLVVPLGLAQPAPG